MAEWLATGLEADVRGAMFAAAARGEAFALATIAAADGGPRPVGAQMVVTANEAWGFLSGGCIEADVALHGREVLEDGAPRTLVYGRGSPFIDMRLPCGGRLEVFVERVAADDPAPARLRDLTERRIPAIWESDGHARTCRAADGADGAGPALAAPAIRTLHAPHQRLLVAGTDPFALAIAALGTQIGWETLLLAPFGPEASPPLGLACDRRPIAAALAAAAPDPWTAIAVASHDLAADEEALVPALRSAAGYVGVLGSRRRLGERIAGLRRAGLSESEIARLRAPIGLPIRARTPWEVAVAVTGEIVALRDEAAAAAGGAAAGGAAAQRPAAE
jgi:xanthine dehydrogenase accessory factor